MTNRRLAFAVLLAAAASASAADAQLAPDQMVAGRQARKFKLQATAKAEYDSNVARTGQALAATQNVKPEDTIYSPTLSIDALLPVGRQAVFLKGYATYLAHDVNTTLDYARIGMASGVGNALGPCGSVVTGSYSRGRGEIEDGVLSTNVRNIRDIARVSAEITCVRPPGLGIIATGARDWSSNSLEAAANGDYETTSASAGFSYGRPALGMLSVVGAYSTTDYNNRPLALGGPNGFESRSVGANFERRLGGRIQANAKLSYTESKVKGAPVTGAALGTRTDFKGITYSAGVTFRASSRLQARAGFGREVRPTLVPGSSFELRTDYNLHADYRIGSRFTVGFGGQLRDIETRGEIPLAARTLTDSRTTSADASLRYRQSNRITLALSGRHEVRDADNPQFDYTSNRVGLAAEFTF